MSSLPQLADALRHVLTEVPDEPLGRQTGFTQRRSKLSPALLVQTLVLGWWANPQASLHELSQGAVKLGVPISPQGLDQRFGPATVRLLQQVLSVAVARLWPGPVTPIPLLRQFTAAVVLDSTTVVLPDQLGAVWAGCGGSSPAHTQAALKLTVGLDLVRGGLHGPELTAGRTQDRATALPAAPLPAGALRLADLGFWSLDVARACGAADAFWLSRLHLGTHVFTAGGERLDLPTWLAQQGTAIVDVAVQLGAAKRLPARLVAQRLPPAVADQRRQGLLDAARRKGKRPTPTALAVAGWTVLVTNLPPERADAPAVGVLARARWQIELLFKLWKQHGGLDQSRSAKPDRILCELYAKLIALVLQQWLLAVSCWEIAERSLVRAAQTVRREVPAVAGALASRRRLTGVLRTIRACLHAGCRLNRRRAKPHSADLLRTPTLSPLA